MVKKKPRPGEARPGGRTNEVKKAVARSVLELISDGNFQFSYSELAAASGVHQTTLYRRWPRHIDLIREAIETHSQRFTIKPGNNWHENAEIIVRSLAEFLSEPAEVAINQALLANPHTAESQVSVEYWRPIQDFLNNLVIDAQSAGELPNDVSSHVIIMTLASPLIIDNTLNMGAISKEDLIVQLIRLARSYAHTP